MERKELIKKILHESEDLDYLSTYHRKAIDIGDKIKKELPKMGTNFNKISHNFGTISSSEIGNTWDTSSLFGQSEALSALSNKIQHMIQTGKAEGIKRMIDAIVTGRQKKLYHISRPDEHNHGKRTKESLGPGHFRWNHKAYQLTPKEIEQIRNYFGYNTINEGLNFPKKKLITNGLKTSEIFSLVEN